MITAEKDPANKEDPNQRANQAEDQVTFRATTEMPLNGSPDEYIQNTEVQYDLNTESGQQPSILHRFQANAEGYDRELITTDADSPHKAALDRKQVQDISNPGNNGFQTEHATQNFTTGAMNNNSKHTTPAHSKNNLDKSFDYMRVKTTERACTEDEGYDHQRIPLDHVEKMKVEINTPAMKELYDLVAVCTSQQRYQKAARHLCDALYLRPVRHDIDSSYILA